MSPDFQIGYFLNALVYAALGLLVFLGATGVVVRALLADLWRSVLDERNVAAAIVVGAAFVAIGIIVAGAMH